MKPDAIVVVDKLAGWTSHDVVAKTRSVLGIRKVGHSGTLDPDATGVLVLGVGRATRLLRFVTALTKSYEFEIVLGVETDTLDASGDVIAEHDMASVTDVQMRAAAQNLTGDIMQTPPMVSAVKVGGRKLYDLARAGVTVDRVARPVSVYRFDVVYSEDEHADTERDEDANTHANTERDEHTVTHANTARDERVNTANTQRLNGGCGVWRASVDCSSGTYIRVLASDLGRSLGGGAHIRSLKRTAVGHFKLADACSVECPELLPMASAVSHLPTVRVDARVEQDVRHGRVVRNGMSSLWAAQNMNGELIAVYNGAKPTVVLAT